MTHQSTASSRSTESPRSDDHTRSPSRCSEPDTHPDTKQLNKRVYSCDSSDSEAGRGDSRRESAKRARDSSSSPPPVKQAKLGYSIMNILSTTSKTKSNNKENVDGDESAEVGETVAAQQTPPAQLNPFLFNPFLAAFSAVAQQHNPTAAAALQQQSLLNNISNLAMLSNMNPPAKQQGEFWPWLNMAAMSALYGLDKNGSPPQDQLKQNRVRPKSPTASPNSTDSSSQLQLQLGHMVNSFLMQQQQPEINPSSTSTSSANSKSTNNQIQGGRFPAPFHFKNASPSTSSPNFLENENNRFDGSYQRCHDEDIINKRKLSSYETGNHHGHQPSSQLNVSENADDDDDDRNNGDQDDLGDDDNRLDDDELGDQDDSDSFDANMRKKKTRTVFSRSQVFQLESTFDMKRYLSSSERSTLAQSLHLTETQIKIWFQNRRNKWKRQLAAEIEANTGNGSNISVQAGPQTGLVQQSNQFGTQMGSNNSHVPTSPNQKVVRVSVLYNNEPNGSNKPDHFRSNGYIEMERSNQPPIPNSISNGSVGSSASSSSSSSSLGSPPTQNPMTAAGRVPNGPQQPAPNPAILSPSMLAAAAAASQFYYAAAAAANQPGGPPTVFPTHFHQSLVAAANAAAAAAQQNPNNSKPLPAIIS